MKRLVCATRMNDAVVAAVRRCGTLPDQSKLSSDARAFYNNSGPGGGKDRNWLLAMSSALPNGACYTNHHFGLGEMQKGIDLKNDAEVLRELHRLEMAQIDQLIAALQPLTRESCVLDGGSGRGGTAFRVHEVSGGARVEGVTVAEDQAAYATAQAAAHGVSDRVRFHVRNMIGLVRAGHYAPQSFTHVVCNETDMYIRDIASLYREFSELLRPDGRFALATWCNDHRLGKVNEFSAAIDKNYGTLMNTDEEIVRALEGAGFRTVHVTDHSQAARPYWDVRSAWSHASGVEQPFKDGLRVGAVRYLIISAAKQQ